MKIFKYEESKLVKIKESEDSDSKIINKDDVEDFLSQSQSKFTLPKHLQRGEIFFALLPLRADGGDNCKPHPVMVIEDFDLDYDKFAVNKKKKKKENNQSPNDTEKKQEQGEQKKLKESEDNKEENSPTLNPQAKDEEQEEKKEEEEKDYVCEKFNLSLPLLKSFYDSFSKGKEPMVLVYSLTTTLIDSVCLGLDAQYKPIAPTIKFPLPYFAKDNLKKFGYIELFKNKELYNGPEKAFAPLLISKRTIFSEAGAVRGSRALLQGMDRLLFSRMLVNSDNWEGKSTDGVLEGNTNLQGKCLIEPLDFDNYGFRNNPLYKKEKITYTRSPLRTESGKEEEVTVTIPVIEELKRSIIFAKYRYLKDKDEYKDDLYKEDLFPCWPNDCWGELKEASSYDDYGNPDISSTNPMVEKSKYIREVKMYKPSEKIFNRYKELYKELFPSNKTYADIPEKKVEFVSDTTEIVKGKPKLKSSYVYFAEKRRPNRFSGMPSLFAWIPYDWQIEAQEEAEKLRKEEEERKRREEEERKKREEEERKRKEEEERRKREIKRTSDGKVIVNLKPKKQVIKVKNTPNTPKEEEPKDTLDTEVPMGEDKVKESKEYSFSELKDFLESF